MGAYSKETHNRSHLARRPFWKTDVLKWRLKTPCQRSALFELVCTREAACHPSAIADTQRHPSRRRVFILVLYVNVAAFITISLNAPHAMSTGRASHLAERQRGEDSGDCHRAGAPIVASGVTHGQDRQMVPEGQIPWRDHRQDPLDAAPCEKSGLPDARRTEPSPPVLASLIFVRSYRIQGVRSHATHLRGPRLVCADKRDGSQVAASAAVADAPHHLWSTTLRIESGHNPNWYAYWLRSPWQM
ncbi:unnamed protein product [Leptidea sinapis]|uniref:Uncharacterized protein n=1 Tax=Leptidea sinapis TaxID=189913 RepID=A0A5E4QPT4_9NEOP|nr:unnamed protein product [Leptidea sinapis]